MKEVKFYLCKECGNVAVKVFDGGGKLVCCGAPMEELTANTVDAAVEKHVPAIEKDGCTVKVQVGSTIHPMEEKHYIQFIAAVQGAKVQYVQLAPGEEPKATFCIDEGPVAIYEYCNLHGLWKTEV